MNDEIAAAIAAPPYLALTLLGYPEVALGGTPLAKPLADKHLALLAYLALESQREHGRAELATLFWPEVGRSDGLGSLRQALHRLSQAFQVTPPVLQIQRQSVRFNATANTWLDVAAFSALFDLCQDHTHTSLETCPECMVRFEQALSLYRDDFLAGFSLPDCDAFLAWQVAHQELLRRQALAALTQLAAFHTRRQEYSQAISNLQRLLRMAPWQEESHRQLMRALALDGQRGAALNQYETCRRLLAEELAVALAPETVALRDRIEAGLLEREVVEASNPYRGLFAFDEQHAGDFYGRERLVQQLLATLGQQPLLAVIGPSGCGKSSLVHAGLVPSLYASGSSPSPAPPKQSPDGEGTTWIVVDLWPGEDPFQSLAEALTPLLSPQQDVEALAQALRQGECSLDDVVASTAAPLNRVLVIVDQFEELYTLCPDVQVRRDFVDLLLPAGVGERSKIEDRPAARLERTHSSAPHSLITVLLSLRADFLGQALAHRPLADALQQGSLMVGTMNLDELRQAVELPARNRGTRFERGLVERLLADVGDDPGNLPLLQFCLTQLWGQQTGGTLTHATYNDIGGLAGALSRYAEHVFHGLSDDQQAMTRPTLTRLVQPREEVADTRRWASRRELGEAGWMLVQALADARLVVTDRTLQGQEQAALTHEALIRHWQRLHEWLEQDQARRLFQHRLLPFLHQWEASGQNAEELLRGALLAEAEEFARSEGAGLSDSERRFVDASIKRRERLQAEIDATLQAELEQAHALARAEQQQAEAANRARQRLRLMSAGLAVVLVVALLAALVAATQRRVADDNAATAAAAQSTAESLSLAAVAAQATAEAESLRAEEQAQLALSRQLGAQAISLADEEMDTALLLSLESLQRSPSSADRTALQADLTVPPLLSTIFHGPAEPIYHLASDDEGTILHSAGEFGTLLRWDLASGQAPSALLPPGTIDAGTFDPTAFAFSTDGRLAAVADGKGFTLWDLEKGDIRFSQPEPHTSAISQIFFTADGSRLLTSDQEDNILLWDTDSELGAGDDHLLTRFTTEEQGHVRAMSPAGDKLALNQIADEISILLWDVESGQVVSDPLPGHTADIHGWTFSPDGTLLATASFDGSVRLWDAVKGAPLLEPLLAHDGRALSVAFSPDGRTLASGGSDNLIYLWDMVTGAQIGPPLRGHGNWVRALRFSDDGESLFSADADGKVLVWEVGARRILDGHQDRVRGVGVTPDGRRLITSGFDGAILLWDAESGEQVGRIDDAHERAIIQIAVSPDGKSLASGDAGGVIKLWDLETLEPLHPPLLGTDSVVISLAFSPDGATLASGDFNGVVRLWDVATGRPISAPMPAHDGWALSLTLSPDGTILSSGGTEGDIKLWQMPATDAGETELEPLGEPLSGHSNWVTSLAFSPDGATLVSTSSDRTIRFWDVDAERPLGEPMVGHHAQVWSAAFDPESGGQVLVTLGGDGSVLRWDVASRELLGPPLLTGKETETMDLSPNGRSLILGSFDEKASQWRLDADAWTEKACRIANRNLDESEWQRFMGDQPYHKACPDLP